MKLLESINSLSSNNLSCLKSINKAIQDRLFWLEMREPDSDGSVYDSWEEKYDEFEEIAEKSSELLENINNDNYDIEISINELKEMICDFQLIYGGLSRIKIV